MASHHDLLGRVAPFLDRHLVLKLLEFAEAQQVHPAAELAAAKVSVLAKTMRVDALRREAERGTPLPFDAAELDRKQDEVVARLNELSGGCQNVLDVLNDAARVEELRTEKKFTLDHLSRTYNVRESELEPLFHLSRFTFDCGQYARSATYIDAFRTLAPATEKYAEKMYQALWGKFAAVMLTAGDAVGEPELEMLNELRDKVESKTHATPRDLLETRTWLLHWALFVFFRHPNGRALLTDMFMQDRYAECISLRAPHLLRYVAAALVLSRRRKHVDKLVRLIESEKYQHSDPVTQVLENLLVHYDFDAAHDALRRTADVFRADYFLAPFADDFRTNAQSLVFETYCQIHKTVDITMVAEKLGLSAEDAEVWIVNLIRNSHLDAKIDSETNTVVMHKQHSSVYQTVIEKTKGLFFRTNLMTNNIDRALSRLMQQQQGGGAGSSGSSGSSKRYRS